MTATKLTLAGSYATLSERSPADFHVITSRPPPMAEVRQSTASVVVIGRLNPWIFQPEWLRAHKIIGQAEAEASMAAANQALLADVAQLDFSALKLIVDLQRFSVTCLEEPLVRAKDFASGCFTLLSHTPAMMLGINREEVYRMSSYENYHRFGDTLGPKAPWSKLLDDRDGDLAQRSGGLRSIMMERSKRPDGLPGYIRVTVEALTTRQPEVKVSVNDHFALSKATGADVCRMLDEHWDSSLARSEEVIRSIREPSDAA